MKKLIILLTFALSFNAYASPKIVVQKQTYYNDLINMYGEHLYISSKEDDLKIENVVINRGNCRIGTAAYEYKIKLRFGQKVRVTPIVGCEIFEVSIDTNKGNQTFEFE